MNPSLQPAQLQAKLRSQLADRRARLESTIADLNQPADLLRLLTQVDAALSRLEAGAYGICEVCHTSIDDDDLLANPMAAYCLCKLSPERQRALERDLDLAWRVQAALLPKPGLAAAGWQTHYRYLPHGPVSGDYCDLIGDNGDSQALYFTLGDVSGKGVAASLLMAHLNASLRSLVSMGLPPWDVVERANRLLAESSLDTHYATLVCGRANSSGEVEIVNAGHCPPVVVRAGGAVEPLGTGGLPLGLTVGGEPGDRYAAEKIVLRQGDALLFYTDGLTDAANPEEEEYGSERLLNVLRRATDTTPRGLVTKCLSDVRTFLRGAEPGDDLTILALGRRV